MNRKIILLFGLLLASLGAPAQDRIETGAEQTGRYLPLLEGRRVGIMTNHTGTVGRTHLVDTLRSLGVDIRVVFAPEHGFRGQADAGESVASYRDRKTGIDVVSVYGSTKRPPDSIMQRLDVLLFDIQDVGLRYYTYLSSMHYLMEACAANGKRLIVLDRPNPNGFYVDGPVLEAKHRSFVGMHPIPVVHGMTLGELARMIDGEGWLRDGLRCKLTVIPCRGYTHRSRYRLPTAPSPNLPNMRAVYLYPSLCFFEGTPVRPGPGNGFPVSGIRTPGAAGRFLVYAAQQRRSQESAAQRQTLPRRRSADLPVRRADMGEGGGPRIRDRLLPAIESGRKILHADVRQTDRHGLRPTDDPARRRSRPDQSPLGGRRGTLQTNPKALPAV